MYNMDSQGRTLTDVKDQDGQHTWLASFMDSVYEINTVCLW